MTPRFECDDAVRVVRALRNDGTFAGRARGELLVRRGSVGYVREWGVFLQDQIIYQVHFLDRDLVVGCRESELIDVDRPWLAGDFQYGDRVRCVQPLAIGGDIVVAAGQQGEVLATAQGERGDNCIVLFGERQFQVPVSALYNLEVEE
ncbi:nitrogen fixation protein NifZ [Dickeya solani]|uniref:Nitrogen fixation protein NifZ n=1 Tax=Dickeya solani TaxID=1089444 RepID=A0ABU4EJU2_9GAMM|nr:nitrogen fixation protein NifZ [Dickeya solani]MCA7000495.1 nitrogen fixation protein NifZ [Dickeya solani]MCZ0821193.1 nitrogen fixation protein NifZ [Dickeya solani]MDV6995079.1 nitrogen fixation protein NifZ [Dickeya solani]MDV7004552.1 nitrogen fixation protein NifZ [Dickeya solani]MDV7037663.1 nitrogen fixation protein NifZ [Dickeya solani]